MIEFRAHEGIISAVDSDGYFRAISNAHAIMLNREGIRQGLWKEYPSSAQANQIKVKIDRALHAIGRIPAMPVGSLNQKELDLRDNALEEFYDIINYAVFSIRILNGEVSPSNSDEPDTV